MRFGSRVGGEGVRRFVSRFGSRVGSEGETG